MRHAHIILRCAFCRNLSRFMFPTILHRTSVTGTHQPLRQAMWTPLSFALRCLVLFAYTTKR